MTNEKFTEYMHDQIHQIELDKWLEGERYLRDYENVLGAGPYLEVQSPEYLLYKNMEPSYEIIMEPSDYWQYDKFGDLGALYDRKANRAFDEMINSQMTPYKNATTIK